MDITLLDGLIDWLQRIAQKNNDEFRYKIEIRCPRSGGKQFTFVCQETVEGHVFLESSGDDLDAVVKHAIQEVPECCEDWGYEV